jgi:hypothetical protein
MIPKKCVRKTGWELADFDALEGHRYIIALFAPLNQQDEGRFLPDLHDDLAELFMVGDARFVYLPEQIPCFDTDAREL